MKTPEENQSEYLRVEITRTQATEIYLKVPKGWRPSPRSSQNIIIKAALETTSESDWRSYDWGDRVDVNGWEPVDEKEAKQFQIFDVIPHLDNR